MSTRIGAAILAVAALALAAVAIIAAVSSSNDCTAHGGHEVFQYYIPTGKGILMPIYKCEGP